MKSKEYLRRKQQEYEAQYAQWEREREDYIKKHGLEAWDAKVQLEIQELYPETKLL